MLQLVVGHWLVTVIVSDVTHLRSLTPMIGPPFHFLQLKEPKDMRNTTTFVYPPAGPTNGPACRYNMYMCIYGLFAVCLFILVHCM